MNLNKKELIFLNRENFYENFELIMKKPSKYIIMISIEYKTFKEDIALIDFLKVKLKKEILDNVIAISDRMFLANDLDIEATLHLKEFKKFEFDNFQKAFNQFKFKFFKLTEFLDAVSSAYLYTLNTYIHENPWFFSINNLGVLLINDKNLTAIQNDYPKMKRRTSDIILIDLNDSEYDETKKKLLKMLGFDSLITFAITNKKNAKFIKNIDLILYNKSKDCFDNSLNFVKSFLRKNNFEKVRNYLDIEERNFDVDIFFEREPIRLPKKYELNFANKRTQSKYKYSERNCFSINEKDKYFVLTKIY